MTIKKTGHHPDYLLFLGVLGLSLFGIIMISSASVVMSYLATGKSTYYLYHQLGSLGIGLVGFFIAYKINYNFWRKIAPIFILINIILLVAVFLPGIGFGYGGARRWIKIGVFTFQPTEAIKLSLIFYLAAWFEKKGEHLKSVLYGIIPFIIVIGLISGLIIAQPDLGTMFLVVSIAGTMFLVAGAELSHIFVLGGAGITTIIALIKAAPYRMARFTIFLNPGAESKGMGYHINQALLAIGSGGLLGLGFGQSRQKYNYLPEAATDSIFAIIAEELGLIRSLLLISVFVFIIYRGIKIAKNAPCIFSRLVALGITTWIAFQVAINLASMLSLVPMTGVTLPFVSYGGSSLILLLFATGILMNISKYTQEVGSAYSNRRRWNWRAYFPGLSRRFRT